MARRARAFGLHDKMPVGGRLGPAGQAPGKPPVRHGTACAELGRISSDDHVRGRWMWGCSCLGDVGLCVLKCQSRSGRWHRWAACVMAVHACSHVVDAGVRAPCCKHT